VDRDELLRVLRAFESARLEYVIIGAAAMGLHGLVRATEDVDIIIRATAENVERLRRAFAAAYDDPNVSEIRTDELLGEYPAVRYSPPDGDLYFDVMVRLDEAADFETVESETKSNRGNQGHCGDAEGAVRSEARDGAPARSAGCSGAPRALRSR
jgi:hypothetical protein